MKTTALLAAALLLTACQSSGPTGSAISAGFPAPDKEMVWQAAVEAFRAQHLAVDSEASSKATWTLVSRWKTQLQPFSGQGWRDKATMRILDVPGRPGYFTLDTQVIRERNMNLVEPSNPLVAEWEQASRSPELEQMLNNRVEMWFLPGGVSQDFRERHRLEGTGDPRIAPEDLPELPEREER